jgi:hypothetical protein
MDATHSDNNVVLPYPVGATIKMARFSIELDIKSNNLFRETFLLEIDGISNFVKRMSSNGLLDLGKFFTIMANLGRNGLITPVKI